MTTAPPAAWTKTHELHVFKQTERRPCSPDSEGAGWMECQTTGLFHLLCNCGYSTGWIRHDQMPTREQLIADHGEPFLSILA